MQARAGLRSYVVSDDSWRVHDWGPAMRFEAAMQYLRSGDRTLVHGVNLTEVDLAIEKHLQLLVAWLARYHAGHCVAIFTEDPRCLGHAFTTDPDVRCRPRVLTPQGVSDRVMFSGSKCDLCTANRQIRVLDLSLGEAAPAHICLFVPRDLYDCSTEGR